MKFKKQGEVILEDRKQVDKRAALTIQEYLDSNKIENLIKKR